MDELTALELIARLKEYGIAYTPREDIDALVEHLEKRNVMRRLIMTDKTELKVIAIAVLILALIAFIGICSISITAQTKLNAIEIVARHHAQEDADWWQIVDLAGGHQ